MIAPLFESPTSKKVLVIIYSYSRKFKFMLAFRFADVDYKPFLFERFNVFQMFLNALFCSQKTVLPSRRFHCYSLDRFIVAIITRWITVNKTITVVNN